MLQICNFLLTNQKVFHGFNRVFNIRILKSSLKCLKPCVLLKTLLKMLKSRRITFCKLKISVFNPPIVDIRKKCLFIAVFVVNIVFNTMLKTVFKTLLIVNNGDK